MISLMIILLIVTSIVSCTKPEKNRTELEYQVRTNLDGENDTVYIHSNDIPLEHKKQFKFVNVSGRMAKSMFLKVKKLPKLPSTTTAKTDKNYGQRKKIIYMNEFLKGNLKVWDDDWVEITEFTDIPQTCKEVSIQPLRPDSGRDTGLEPDQLTQIFQDYLLKKGSFIWNVGIRYEIDLSRQITFIVKYPRSVSASLTYCYPQIVQKKDGSSVLSIEKSKLHVSYPVGASNEPPTLNELLGGASQQLEKIQEYIIEPLNSRELYDALSISPPKGLLLYGPPGTGKTSIARAISQTANASFYSVNGPELIQGGTGQSEEQLRRLFEVAKYSSPSIIFFDEIDSVAMTRDEGDAASRSLSIQLLTLMDGIDVGENEKGKKPTVVVVAATNRPAALDPAFRRFGRFDKEIYVGAPSEEGRLDVLRTIMEDKKKSPDLDLRPIAQKTHGFTASDLKSLCVEAVQRSIMRAEEFGSVQEQLGRLQVTQKDFFDALEVTRPSAMRDVQEVPKNFTWAKNIGGLEDVHRQLKELIETPMNYSFIYEQQFSNMNPPRGALLYGPPGCGKTTIAKAIAGETGANFISIKGSELLSPNTGETERLIKELFEKARRNAPCIIFFDEIDAIAKTRGKSSGPDAALLDRAVVALLKALDNDEANKQVFVLAATNLPTEIDSAVIRPGRIGQQVYIPNPDKGSRLKILQLLIDRVANKEKDLDLDNMADSTECFSSADVTELVRKAIGCAIKDALGGSISALTSDDKRPQETPIITLKNKHLQEALGKISSSILNDLDKLEKLKLAPPGTSAKCKKQKEKIFHKKVKTQKLKGSR